jgi:multidrug resistance protein, MATE family
MLSHSYKTILAVALPMMGASFVQSIVLLTDSAFLSRYSTDDFAAVGNAGLIYITMHMFVVGISDGSQILISRKIGENRYGLIGQILLSSFLTLAVIVGGVVLFSQTLLPEIILSYVKHEDIAWKQIDFLSIRSFGLMFTMISLPIQAYYFAFGKSWVPLVGAIITAVGNIILDYGLIFGNLGMPEMGLKGASLASTLADGLDAVFLLAFLFLSKEHVKHQLFKGFKLAKDTLLDIVKISFPIVLQGTVALSTWAIFFIFIEQMGKFELTVSQNIRTIYFLAFVPVWGFAAATKTYISQAVGAKKTRLIPFLQRRIQLLSLLFMLLLFHGSFLYPETIISWINPDERYLAKSVDLLHYVSLSMFIFAFISVYFQTINGLGKTHITFAIETFSVLIYITSGYLFIKVFKWDLVYTWTVEYVYFLTIGALSLGYLKLVDWKKDLYKN